MTNIAAGSVLVIDDGSAQEAVTVTAVTPTTFTATATKAHDGTTTPFPVVGASFPAIGEGWLNCLAATGWLTGSAGQDGPDPATAASLTGVLTALPDFARHEAGPVARPTAGCSRVLQNPSAQLPVSPAAAQLPTTALPAANSALLSLTGWSLASVNALLTQFFGSTNPASLSSVENLRRVYDAYAIVTSTGLAAPALISAITNAPTPTTVSALQSALRAQYAAGGLADRDPPDQRPGAGSQQRDALVAYILQQLGDQLRRSLCCPCRPPRRPAPAPRS